MLWMAWYSCINACVQFFFLCQEIKWWSHFNFKNSYILFSATYWYLLVEHIFSHLQYAKENLQSMATTWGSQGNFLLAILHFEKSLKSLIGLVNLLGCSFTKLNMHQNSEQMSVLSELTLWSMGRWHLHYEQFSWVMVVATLTRSLQDGSAISL